MLYVAFDLVSNTHRQDDQQHQCDDFDDHDDDGNDNQCLFSLVSLSLPGVVSFSFRMLIILDTSSSQAFTVASIARQVKPSAEAHPRPFTVTGPTRPRSSRSADDAFTSHTTPVCSLSRRFNATTANCEMRPDVMPVEDEEVPGAAFDGDRGEVKGVRRGAPDATIDKEENPLVIWTWSSTASASTSRAPVLATRLVVMLDAVFCAAIVLCKVVVAAWLLLSILFLQCCERERNPFVSCYSSCCDCVPLLNDCRLCFVYAGQSLGGDNHVLRLVRWWFVEGRLGWCAGRTIGGFMYLLL